MKNSKRNKKSDLKFIPDLTVDKELKYVKNALFIFLFCIIASYLTFFLETDKRMASNIPEFSQTKYPPIREMKMKKMVGNRPLADMIPYIFKQDRKTAIFLVAIAKKESDWGKYSPKKGRKECYNYWGFRGTYNQTTSGYSCFDSEEQAVEIVGRRINELIRNGADTPEKMVVWKCGKNCSGHSDQSVQKWISDVDFYYQKIKG